MRRLNRADVGFDAELEKLLAWEGVSNDQVNQTVREILDKIRSHGDAALVEYTNRFDRLDASSMEELELPLERLQQALDNLPTDQRKALELSAERVRLYHQHQKTESWSYTEADGTLLG
ncbi:MAG TPA: histidinol dehydrogenase, partial [Gammaproteobacteria bacterium]|nr:histidinol dehydrogenase [Gammaproteobacteria bacterium]